MGVTVVGVVVAGVVAVVAELPEVLELVVPPVDAEELVVAAGTDVVVEVLEVFDPYSWPTKTTSPPVATMALMAVKVVAVRIRWAPTALG